MKRLKYWWCRAFHHKHHYDVWKAKPLKKSSCRLCQHSWINGAN